MYYRLQPDIKLSYLILSYYLSVRDTITKYLTK